MSAMTEHRADRSSVRPAPALSTHRKRLSMDDRMDLAISATSRDSRNKPVLLPLVAIIALIVSALYAGIAYMQLSSAKKTEMQNARWAGEFRTQLNTYSSLISANSGEEVATDIYEPATDFLSTMSSLWSAVGLEGQSPGFSEPRNPIGKPESQLEEYKVRYNNFTTKSIGPVLDWIERGLTRFRGTELSQFDIKVIPNQGWQVSTIEFRRIQKKKN
ncbi:MAG: hypothetical protein H6815_05740 [Phycisphaeraceae bacterium]|nr:hypothetical protein [Phycisphaerales bacterium]MCB9859940.1 hypothetical protein [Phycisphaeraceae bacterium]